MVPLESGVSELTVLEPAAVPRTLGTVDVVLPLLHGPFGEDGTLQGLLELADVRYVGSGVLSSAVSMDKHYMKLVLEAEGLPVGPHFVVTARQWQRDRDQVYQDAEELGWPVFVKPARAGSSLGITKVKGPADLEAAIEEARRHDPKVVIEAMITGREIECAVLESPNGGPPATSLPGEIVVVRGHDFYDFDAKYLDDVATFDIPADLPAAVTARIQELARRAFSALDAQGLARVDFFVRQDGEVVINEVNTLPGFTPISMYPRMWAAGGLGYQELITTLIRTALARGTGLR
jgi:D-alanine-D-alanine ligase